MRLRTLCAVLVGVAAIAGPSYGGEVRLDILGLSPGMSQADAERVISEHRWNCEAHDYKFFATRECIVQQPKINKISFYYNCLMPNHPIFRVRAKGAVSVDEASAQFGRRPDMNGNVFHIWRLGNGLEAELLEIMETTELLLSSAEFSPAGGLKPARESPRPLGQ